MFGFLKRRRDQRKLSESRERIISDITGAHSKIEMLIRAQTRMLKFLDGYEVHDLYQEEYFRLYIYGAYDSATMKYGPEVRSKIGLSLIRIGLTKYISEEISNGNQSDAYDAANAVIEECLRLSDLTSNRAVIDGGIEASEFLAGKHAQNGRLMLHFAGDHGILGKQDVDEFLKFMAEDDLRLKRIRAM